MKKVLVYDCEANGFLEDATSVHCIVAKEFRSDKVYRFWDSVSILHGNNDFYLIRESIENIFTQYDKIVCHNQIIYDNELILKFFGIDLWNMFGPEGIIDTYVLSQLLNPDRELPKGCPTSIVPSKELRELGYKSKKVGPHGLESWGYRTGHRKLAIYDWSKFTPSMLDRCEGDVIINEMTLEKLMLEGNLEEYILNC